MAGNLINSLYAPLVSTFMPAFPNDQDAAVFFTYSPLNDITLVKRIHVSVVNQATNENALNDDTGVLIYETQSAAGDGTVGYDVNSDMYYVLIPKTYLKNNSWNINQFYKVQLRLDSNDEASYGTLKEKTAYLSDYNKQLKFSEWSTVCLLRPILQPSIILRGLIASKEEGQVPAFNQGIVPIGGRVIFGNNDTSETETLQSFTIDILERDSKKKVYSTGNIYTGNSLDPNDINYKLNLQGIDTSATRNFTLHLTITTKNQYSMSQDFDFDIADFVEMTDFHPIGINEDPNDHSLKVTLNEEEGIASFHFINDAAVYGILYVKRSSSISNFTNWESIYEGRVSNTIDMTITDNTVGSHIWYRYSIQLENSVGGLSQVYYTDIFFPQFYEAFLSRKDKIFPIRYDFKVASMKPIVNRSKIDTLGGRYPKFAENAVLNYKQFSISGTISAEGDWHQLFLKKSTYYGTDYNNYKIYLSQNNIQDLVRNDSKYYDDANTYLTTTLDDSFWEREFREEAIAWLNDGEPKLFRSMTEGLIPVMLTDINLTPKAQLGRRLYDFTATMYEIADGHSLATLESLGIIDIPHISEIQGSIGDTPGSPNQPSGDYRTVTSIGQVWEISPSHTNNILTSSGSDTVPDGAIYDSIMRKYSMGGIYSNRQVMSGSIYIKNVQIYFHSEPHMFAIDGNNVTVVSNMTTSSAQEQYKNKQIQLGYTFQLQTSDSTGWKTIFVNERGYYQIPEHLNVTGLAFNQTTSNVPAGVQPDRVTINYIVVYNEQASQGTLVTGQSIDRTLVGQYQGVYKANQYLGELIRNKYTYITENYTQKMQYWRGISLDVTPYAVAYIKYRNGSDYTEYLVGQSGILNMFQDYQVIDMCFLGKRMVKQPIERQKYLAEHEYVNSEESYETTSVIKHPKANTVYDIDGQDMIYYHDNWYNFNERNDGTGIAEVNIEGAINFLGDVVQISY